ncbi:MAG TPA: Uma2 family endonuclease [Longimicrobium sp.]|nr:Uma2 family endonuclease [Longimicrobium sp.]
MTAQSAARRWTYAEFARLPDDGNRYEVIAGELYMTPAPHPFHQEVVIRLSEWLRPYVREHRLGRVIVSPVDVLFAEGDYFSPDLVFVRRERREAITARGVEGPPDLVVEVVSPGGGPRDRVLKRQRYAGFGVPEYWVVDPMLRQVEVYRPDAEPFIASTTLEWRPQSTLPVLAIELAELFSEPD